MYKRQAKVCIAIISGFLAELVYVNVFKKKEKDMDIHVVCEEEHCSCEDGVLKLSLIHIFGKLLAVEWNGKG